MFEHSIKVPRLYKKSAQIAKQVVEEGASLKELVYGKLNINVKGHFALVVTTLQNARKLDIILRKTNVLINTRIDPWLARVLITELLWGKKRVSGESKPVKTIRSLHTKFLEILSTLTDVEDIQPKKVTKPRYVRVNTLKTSLNVVVDVFRDEGWTLISCGNNSDYPAFLATVHSLSVDQFMIDFHVKELLIFPPNTQFYQHPLYVDGQIILQDKASCLAALLLNPPIGSVVLDTCAAPGMKTSYLSAMVGKYGKVYAVEKHIKRFEVMRQLLESYGVSNVLYFNGSMIDLTDFPDAKYILVDPSCSGSGMLDRVEYESADVKNNEYRLQTLSAFQILILKHALTKFPKVKRVIYSTCSIHAEENEEVVKKVLTCVKKFKLVPIGSRLKNWHNFGLKEYGEIGSSCLSTKPEEDLTNGFFIAMFERTAKGERNPFYVKSTKKTIDSKRNLSDKNIFKNRSADEAETEIKEKSYLSEVKKVKKLKAKNSTGDLYECNTVIVKGEKQLTEFKKIKKVKTELEELEQNTYDEYSLPENINTEKDLNDTEYKTKHKNKSKKLKTEADVNQVDSLPKERKHKNNNKKIKTEIEMLEQNTSNSVSENIKTADLNATEYNTTEHKKKSKKLKPEAEVNQVDSLPKERKRKNNNKKIKTEIEKLEQNTYDEYSVSENIKTEDLNGTHTTEHKKKSKKSKTEVEVNEVHALPKERKRKNNHNKTNTEIEKFEQNTYDDYTVPKNIKTEDLNDTEYISTKHNKKSKKLKTEVDSLSKERKRKDIYEDDKGEKKIKTA